MNAAKQSMATGTEDARVTVATDPKAAPTVGAVTGPDVLRDAMLELADVLADLEIDMANTLRAAKRSNSPRQRRGLLNLAARCEAQLNRLRVFFDWDVYHERVPAHSEAA